MRRILMALALSALAASAFGATDFKKLLKEIDEMGDFGKSDYTAVYSIASEKPGEKPVNMEVKIFRRDELDQLVITIRKPEDQKGQGYLKKGDTILFYDPSSGETVPTKANKTVGNSDAQNGDFKKYTFAEDYDILSTAEGTISGYAVWILDLKAKNKEVQYDRIKLYVRKDKPVPLQEQDYAVSGALYRTVKYAPSYTTVAGKLIPTKIKIVDEFNKGQQSLLEISEVKVGKLSDSIFTPEYLKMAQ